MRQTSWGLCQVRENLHLLVAKEQNAQPEKQAYAVLSTDKLRSLVAHLEQQKKTGQGFQLGGFRCEVEGKMPGVSSYQVDVNFGQSLLRILQNYQAALQAGTAPKCEGEPDETAVLAF